MESYREESCLFTPSSAIVLDKQRNDQMLFCEWRQQLKQRCFCIFLMKEWLCLSRGDLRGRVKSSLSKCQNQRWLKSACLVIHCYELSNSGHTFLITEQTSVSSSYMKPPVHKQHRHRETINSDIKRYSGVTLSLHVLEKLRSETSSVLFPALVWFPALLTAQ